jgi:hypothetical protein
LIALDGATPKRSAADRADAPANTAFTTRSRKSFEQALGMTAGLLPSSHVESEIIPLGNPTRFNSAQNRSRAHTAGLVQFRSE